MTTGYPAAPGESWGRVVRYDEALAPQIVAFQRENYPNRRPDWIEPRWRWMFVDSAARVGIEPLVWLVCDRSHVVAHRAAIPVRLHTRTGELDAGWLVETSVLPRLRGKAIGTMLVARATADLPVSLSLGQTEQMRALQARHGWQHVATMDNWLLVLNPRRAFQGRIRSSLLRAVTARAGWAWHRTSRVLHGLGRVRRRMVGRRVEAFGPEHDVLWARLRDQYGCVVVRDASYLNWKYVAQPGQQFRRLAVYEGERVCAVCVWAMYEPDGRHQYRRGWILDAIVEHDDAAAVTALLEAVTADAVQAGADIVEFDLLSRDLGPHLRRFGFIRGARTRHLRVSTHGVDPQVAALLRSPKQWYLTRGDSDGDHPWWTPAGRESATRSTDVAP